MQHGLTELSKRQEPFGTQHRPVLRARDLAVITVDVREVGARRAGTPGAHTKKREEKKDEGYL